jgi:hypothetical protein
MPASSALPRTPATVERAMLLDVVGDPAYRAGGAEFPHSLAEGRNDLYFEPGFDVDSRKPFHIA